MTCIGDNVINYSELLNNNRYYASMWSSLLAFYTGQNKEWNSHWTYRWWLETHDNL